jgi:hypothetical protein
MARGCGRRPLRGGEEGRAAVGECAGRWSGAPGGEVERRGKARGRRAGRRPAASSGRKGVARLEVGDGPDVWAPHVSGQREREGGGRSGPGGPKVDGPRLG